MANPNPSPETRFRLGQSGNPGGKTSDQRRLEIENAESATRIRAALLKAVTDQIEMGAEIELTGDLLRLLKDAEDRGLGQPVQPLDINARISQLSDDELDAEIASALEKLGLTSVGSRTAGANRC